MSPDGITSVTLSTDKESVTVTGDEFDRATRQFQQLSFDIGGHHSRPTGGSLKITGSGNLSSEIYMDDDVTINVVNSDGEAVASFDGRCVNVAFKKHTETNDAPAWVERIQTIKLGD